MADTLTPTETALAILEQGSKNPETGEVCVGKVAMLELLEADPELSAERIFDYDVWITGGTAFYCFSAEVVAEYKRLHDHD